MKQTPFTLLENTPLTAEVHQLRLRGDCAAVTAPGQFVQVLVPGQFLRRPFSVCDRSGDTLPLCVRRVGRGTETLCSLPAGATLDLLTGLGNGFTLDHAGGAPLLIGGGSGVGALYGLCRALLAAGKSVTAALCFRSAEQIYYVNQLKALGAAVRVYTEDGGAGTRGRATDALALPHSSLYACGPVAMLAALDGLESGPAQLSLEARMGCGFGACMGCTIETAAGARRVCRDGPVFPGKAVVW